MQKLLRNLMVLVVAVVALIFQQMGGSDADTSGGANGGDVNRDAARIVAAFEAQQSDLWVETEGRVERKLRDDNEGSRHQKFIVRLDNGHSVLIAHNIDLAPRVPLEEGDRIRFRGEYEWNDRGGVVHWTHHDPQGRHEGGWIQLASNIYK
ncbi:MAG: DUF3465 domain-containing protein [Pseudomonadota bacterium]